MMRKTNIAYYFTVEGDTEKWYLEWLKNSINACESINSTVSFKYYVEKNPVKAAKKLTNIKNIVLWHFSDYEVVGDDYSARFKETMDNMKKVSSLNKGIVCKFGYSNLTFDLWIVLHKIDCNGPKQSVDNYLTHINKGYNEKFSSMREYKREDNFKRCLVKLTIEDVKKAIIRAKMISNTNKNKGYILKEYKGFKYYDENPAIDVWIIIEKIMIDCGLM